MMAASSKSTITVALVGNPNTGKSTLFNALCGMTQRVGNYPGVTVEKKTGQYKHDDHTFEVIDLPGTYSLAPKSPDEVVALQVLLGQQADVTAPEVVVCVVDASNLERNLYLVSQVTDLGVPVVLALNMTDVALAKEIQIDVETLAKNLDVPVVEMQANRKKGLAELSKVILSAHQAKRPVSGHEFPKVIESEIGEIARAIDPRDNDPNARFLAQRLLLDNSGLLEDLMDPSPNVVSAVQESRQRLDGESIQLTSAESISRYQNINRLIEGVVKHPPRRPSTFTDRIDKILTHKVWGTLVFALLMLLVFQAIFSWAGPFMDAIDGLIGYCSEIVSGWMPEGALKSLVTDGVIAGVGSVVIFVPQIMILFLFMAILEDCGYMARAAYLMDKLMSKVGLSGKSFIPLLSSFACAIPGIMASRVIENRRDRLITILIAPLMSCSARLPVYILLIAAFVPATYPLGWIGLQPLVMFSMYLLGVLVAVGVALILKKTILPGETPAFVMELPNYKLPSIKLVFLRMLERAWAFIRRAGSLIFAVSIVIWALSYFPRPASIESDIRERHGSFDAASMSMSEAEFESEVENEIRSAYMQQSLLARAGKTIEPVVKPLGWDWRIASGAVASFPAREVIIGTLGVLYNVGDDADENSESLRERLQNATWDGTDEKVFNLPVALGLMVFFALCAQCVSTLVIMARETASWRWPIFTFVYMTALAYIGALITYQVGMLFIN